METRNYKSLILTGDHKGFDYIKTTAKEAPQNAFNFCCTIDGSTKMEANLAQRPQKNNSKDKERQRQAYEQEMERNRLMKEKEDMMRRKQLEEQMQHDNIAKTFWTPENIRKYTSAAQANFQKALTPGGKKLSAKDALKKLKQRNDACLLKYEEVRASLQKEVDKEYQANRYKQNEEKITYEQYLEMKQQINYDIAWQLFDEINQYNDTDQYIDLNCLDLIDAQAITKQKIYDTAVIARDQQQQQNKTRSNKKSIHLVLSIQCGDNHMTLIGNEHTNGILDTVKNELQMDHYYITQTKTIFIRIDAETLDNSVLNEW